MIFTQGELFDYTALDALNTLSKQCAAAAAASEGSCVPAAFAPDYSHAPRSPSHLRV